MPARLAALRRAGVLDLSSDSRLERITRLAAALLGTPVSLVSLVDADQQVFAAQIGVPEPWASRGSTPLSHSFCQHVVADDAPLVVADARQDARLRDNRAIVDLGVIAYCGVPLRTNDGHTLGSFCVVDHRPRQWTPEEVALVGDLAALAQTELALAAGDRDGRSRSAALAHDMRSMLHGVVGGARTLGQQPLLDEDQRDQLLGVVERQAERLAGMLELLMDGEPPRTEVTVSPVDLGVVLAEVVEEYRRVQLSVDLADGRARIRVADDGPGIPGDRRDAVFARGHRGTTGSGRGIGLHTVRWLAEAMGGEAWLATDDAPGATFVVELATT